MQPQALLKSSGLGLRLQGLVRVSGWGLGFPSLGFRVSGRGIATTPKPRKVAGLLNLTYQSGLGFRV